MFNACLPSDGLTVSMGAMEAIGRGSALAAAFADSVESGESSQGPERCTFGKVAGDRRRLLLSVARLSSEHLVIFFVIAYVVGCIVVFTIVEVVAFSVFVVVALQGFRAIARPIPRMPPVRSVGFCAIGD